MFRKRPGLAKGFSIIAVLLYLGLLYLIVAVLAKPATPNSSPFGSLFGANSSNPEGMVSRYYPQLVLTSDGGKNWQPANPLDTNDSPYFSDVSCIQPDRCYAVGLSSGTIYESRDAGKKWVLRHSVEKTQMKNIDCTSLLCIAAGYDRANTVFLTSLDGQKWQRLELGLSTGDITDVVCPTIETCYAVGSEGRILKSTDSGKTWLLQDAGIARTFNSISCITASSCVIVGSVGTVLTTENGGQTWSKQSFGYAKDFTVVKCPTSTLCLALGGTTSSGEVLRSADGGKKWEIIKSDATPQGSYLTLSCPTAQDCFIATGLGKIRATSDGGQTWSVQAPLNTKVFRNLSCSTATNCTALTLPFSLDYAEYDD